MDERKWEMGNKTYKKIVFLDIDGVMASTPYLCKKNHIGFIDPKKCKILNMLRDIGAEIVISSSWGYDEGRTEKTLRECGLTIPIIGYTEHFYNDWICRGNEIEKWIQDNFGGMGTKYYEDYEGTPYYRKHYHEDDIDYEYVIFDDNEDMLYGQKDNFIKINQNTGLTKRHIAKAIKILNREK